MSRRTTYWLFGAISVLLIFGALGWWYYTLRGTTADSNDIDIRRNLGQESPTFGAPTGSTLENVASTNDAFGTEAASDNGPLPRLAHISTTPAAGMAFTGVGQSLRLRFVERATGYVLESDLTRNPLARLTNVLTPRIYEAVLAEGTVVMRTLEDTGAITTTVGTLPVGTTTSGLLSARRLSDGIREFVLSSDGKDAVYLYASPSGGALIARADLSKSTSQQIFSSGIAGWQVVGSPERIVLVQGVSSAAGGYAYRLKGGALVPLLRNIRGLTVLPHPTSDAFVYSDASRSSLLARLTDTSAVIALPVKTVPEKCVWSRGAGYILFCAVPQRAISSTFLDEWYRGETHTADTLWRIDVSANTAEMVYTPSIDLDVEKPVLDNSGAYIAFKNARDGSPWLLRITE